MGINAFNLEGISKITTLRKVAGKGPCNHFAISTFNRRPALLTNRTLGESNIFQTITCVFLDGTENAERPLFKCTNPRGDKVSEKFVIESSNASFALISGGDNLLVP